jgi:hypothetical protein
MFAVMAFRIRIAGALSAAPLSLLSFDVRANRIPAPHGFFVLLPENSAIAPAATLDSESTVGTAFEPVIRAAPGIEFRASPEGMPVLG